MNDFMNPDAVAAVDHALSTTRAVRLRLDLERPVDDQETGDRRTELPEAQPALRRLVLEEAGRAAKARTEQARGAEAQAAEARSPARQMAKHDGSENVDSVWLTPAAACDSK